jgi:hypothetical protein
VDRALCSRREGNGLEQALVQWVVYWSLDDLLTDVSTAQGDFQNINASVQEAVRHALEKAENFIHKMDENILYYVATVLDSGIKTSLIAAHIDSVDARLIVSQVRDFLKTEYPFRFSLQPEPKQPAGMPDSLWKALRRLKPGADVQMSDIDKYLDSTTVSWSQSCVEDGNADWVLKW